MLKLYLNNEKIWIENVVYRVLKRMYIGCYLNARSIGGMHSEYTLVFVFFFKYGEGRDSYTKYIY